MIPKVRSAAEALAKGVEKVHFIAGSLPHGLLLEVFDGREVVVIVIAAILSSTVGALIPALRAAFVDPVRSLRYE